MSKSSIAAVLTSFGHSSTGSGHTVFPIRALLALLASLALIVVSVGLSGCSSSPKALSPADVAERKVDFLIRHAGFLDQRQINVIHQLPDTRDSQQLNQDFNRVLTDPGSFKVNAADFGKRRRVLGRTAADLYRSPKKKESSKKKDE